MKRPFRTIEIHVDPAAGTEAWVLETIAEIAQNALEGYTDLLRVRVLTAPAEDG